MKKGMFLLVLVVMIASMPVMTFATVDVQEPEICCVEDFKVELNRLNVDGRLSTAEKNYLIQNTAEDVVDDFVGEKLEDAVNLLNKAPDNDGILSLEGGQEYKCQTYDLGDGCQLIVELEDRAEDLTGSANTRATSGSNTLWKGYGNRYFTASAKVVFSLGTVTMKLRNHYTLSSKGIDERYGVESFTANISSGTISATDPVITDATARTVGESDVNMECQFTLKYSDANGFSMKKQYIMESKVGFVDIDKAGEQVKVKQSWTLTRI